MDVRTSFCVCILLMHLTAGQLLWSQAVHTKHGQTPPPQALHSRMGFLNFILKRINPSEQDYGQAITIERDHLQKETIENGYFWSNVVALSLLGFMFFVVLYEQRKVNRAAWNYAELMVQYEHALRRANAEIENASRRNKDLVKSLLKMKEGGLSPRSERSESIDVPLVRETRRRQVETPSFFSDTSRSKQLQPAKSSAGASVHVAKTPGTQIGLFKSDVDFIVKINSLEQQLAHSRDVESELRRQLSESGRKVQVELETNRKIKSG